MSKRDYYEALGLSKNASKKDIKLAYRKLAKEFHPDKNKDASAESRFKEVQEAYDVLSDDQKRSAYDQYGHAATDGFGGGGFSDNTSGFEDFFGSGSGGLGDLLGGLLGGGDFSNFSGSSRGRATSSTGSDLQVVLKLSFMEAVFGVEKEIKYRRMVKCDFCKGSGAKDGKLKTCGTCHGRGQTVQIQRTMLGSMQVVSTCPTCRGVGEVASENCNYCRGNGVNDFSENLKIKIPAGIPDGVTMKFEEKGSAGPRGGGYGRLFVVIEVDADEVFERRGNDIYMDKKIDIVTAVLGGEIVVSTVHGNLKMVVPEGTQSEKVLRLKEKGGPVFRQNHNGDQYVRLIVVTPQNINSSQRRLWEQLRNIN